ncbi:(deoxy)nucleoside triphosphate pyrophosphohydrolase [Propionibacteriaceae bacterium G1746]|uniref:(deoxy)nucleoside triphosphate pyrophosphohydrolase n=1 Tax=Aestuariimicrobium sp. G57 TaxID=3418485 RepID=UPI003C240E9A
MRLVVAAILVDGHGRVLAAQRAYPAQLAGKWEFPGGKTEPGESAREGLVREIGEELGIEVTLGDELPGPDHGHWPINDHLELRAFFATSQSDPTVGDDHHDLCWVAPDDLAALDWLPADVALAAAVYATMTP